MKIGIDGINLRGGGGVTHLKEFLTYAAPKEHGIEQIIVFSGQKTLDQLPERPWLIKHHDKLLDKSLFFRASFQLFKLDWELKKYGCDVLFAPGGTYIGTFYPFVGMSQNMLLFEKIERNRHGLSWVWLRLYILEKLQKRCFNKAEGIIFISKYAESYITRYIKKIKNKEIKLIHHGVSKRFEQSPKPQLPISAYSIAKPFQLLYISSVDCYKHQWILVEATAQLRKLGYPITLEIIGAPLFPKSVARLKKTLTKFDPNGSFAVYHGSVPFEQIQHAYHKADGFVYSSTCENMPNIVIEAMSSGLPIVASNYGPMPEFLKDACLYFDPTSVENTVATLKEFLDDPKQRANIAIKSHQYAEQYTWETCSAQTLEFLAHIAAKVSSYYYTTP